MPIGYVAAYNIRTDTGYWPSQLGEFGVWVSDIPGDITSFRAVKCGESSYRGGAVGLDTDPYVLWCSGAVGDYVTLKQSGARRYLVISEIYAYAANLLPPYVLLPQSALVPLPLLSVAASSYFALTEYPAANVIDGNLTSSFASAMGVGNWVSVRVPDGAPVDAVAVYNVRSSTSSLTAELGAFEVFLAHTIGPDRSNATGEATRSAIPSVEACGQAHSREQINGADVAPYVLRCAGSGQSIGDGPLYVTIRQLGSHSRHLLVTELVVYQRPYPRPPSPPRVPPSPPSCPVPPICPPPIRPPPAPTAPPIPPPLLPPAPPVLPPPLLSRGSADSLLSHLNAQFWNGKPSGQLAECGVLVRQFDGLDGSGTGGHRSWQPCPMDDWCGRYHAQWPSSIINSRMRHTYYPDVGGLVLDSRRVTLFCAYGSECANPITSNLIQYCLNVRDSLKPSPVQPTPAFCRLNAAAIRWLTRVVVGTATVLLASQGVIQSAHSVRTLVATGRAPGHRPC